MRPARIDAVNGAGAPSGLERHSDAVIRRALRALLQHVGRASTCRLSVEFADGTRIRNHEGMEQSEVGIRFANAAAERESLFFFPDGLVEAWIAGDVEIQGWRPIVALARLAHAAFAAKSGRRMPVNPLARARQIVQERLTNNRDIVQAKRNAEFHYAMDVRLFEAMLGPTLGYSEGYWPEGTRTLDQAKHNNYEYACRKLRLQPGDHVVEVGAGWGYLAILMVKKFGAKVTIYNPVKAQNDFMRARFLSQGVGDDIRILEKDHRDIAGEAGAYDKFVSIGVQEHCGRDCYRSWIEAMAAALKPGGVGLLSTTSLMHREYTNAVILRHIFPGGHVPSLPLMLKIMDENDLTLVDVENLWPHYQKTLECWLSNFEAAWPGLQKINPALFTESFRCAWSFYLEGTIENFDYALDLSHITFVKGRFVQINGLTRSQIHAGAEFATGDTSVDPLR